MSVDLLNKYLGLWQGTIDNRASSNINAIYDESFRKNVCHIGDSVSIVDSPIGELLPRISDTTSVTRNNFYGIAVYGDKRGVYPENNETSNSFFNTNNNVIARSGDSVRICTQGRCIARVTTFSNTINIGDPLSPNSSAELIHATFGSNNIVARALQSVPQIVIGGSVQFIAVDIQREGLT